MLKQAAARDQDRESESKNESESNAYKQDRALNRDPVKAPYKRQINIHLNGNINIENHIIVLQGREDKRGLVPKMNKQLQEHFKPTSASVLAVPSASKQLARHVIEDLELGGNDVGDDPPIMTMPHSPSVKLANFSAHT